MPRVKHTEPAPSKEKGEINIQLPEWLWRGVPRWMQPEWLHANTWRAAVALQPFAVVCRETIISDYLALDWQIDAKDSDMRDELKSEIDYYTEFFTHTGEFSYEEIIEWIGKDLLDIPFGTAAEVGRENSEPTGRVVWIDPLDGGTLFPTLNKKWPVGQYVREIPGELPVYFPWFSINRVYMSPRTELKRKGWGMAPPEKIYLGIQLINRGDKYYANLLLDTPEAGILDLGDMEQAAAEEWIKAWKELLTGIDAFKIPVLYEHNTEVKYLPFNRSPHELAFKDVITKYDALVAAGYGISLSDVGIQVAVSGGETLAGSIRQERRSKKTGFARFGAKMVQFWNFMLPDTLKYATIDQDDEQSVAKGRAILSNATGYGQLVDKRVFTPGEVRRMMIADGLVSVNVPEEVPEDEFPDELLMGGNGTNERTGMLGKPVSPSQGGHGEVKSLIEKEIERIVNIEDVRLRRLIRSAIDPIFVLTKEAIGEFGRPGEIEAWNDWIDELIWGETLEEMPELAVTSTANARSKLKKSMQGDEWWELSIDSALVVADLKDIFDEAVEAKLSQEHLLKYEKGEVDELEPELQIDESHYDGFGEIVSQSLSEFWETIPERIQNCVISGTRKALSSEIIANDVAKSLDTQEIINDNTLVIYCRRELQNMESKLVVEFGNRLSNIIQELLKEI